MGNKSYRTRWLRFLRLLERIHWGASEFARTLVWPRHTTRVGPFPSTLPISFGTGFALAEHVSVVPFSTVETVRRP